LIELLIVIVIIGVLSVPCLWNKSGSELAQSRDAKTEIGSGADTECAGELLCGEFCVSSGRKLHTHPPGNNCYVNSKGGSSWIPALVSSGDLPMVPADPKNSGGSPWNAGGYEYSYGNVTADGQNFDLVAQLETRTTPTFVV